MAQEINLVFEAFKFMLLGMTVVFSFLVLLFFMLTIQHKVIALFVKEDEIDSNSPNKHTGVSAKKVAAIMGAIEAFREKKN